MSNVMDVENILHSIDYYPARKHDIVMASFKKGYNNIQFGLLRIKYYIISRRSLNRSENVHKTRLISNDLV